MTARSSTPAAQLNVPISPPPAPGEHPHGPRRRPPALWVRLLLLAVGWVVLLVGIAGLALPGIQGVLTILVGAAILSIASESIYRLLKRLLHQRWPRMWARLDRFRERWRERLGRWR